MGLDTSHDCWHGAYSAFMRWRETIAQAAGLPPLQLMEGFYSPPDKGMSILYAGPDGAAYLKHIDEQLPIKWGCLKPSPIHILLNHSDCEGEIAHEDCAAIADTLEALLTNLPKGDAGGHIGDFRGKTQSFIDGLRKASTAKENVNFH